MDNLINSTPVIAGVKKKYNKRRVIRFLEHEEVRKIITAIPFTRKGVRDRAILEVLYSTGARISECLGLKRELFIRADPGKTLELTLVGKGGFQRVVFVSPRAMQAVIKYLAGTVDSEGEKLFPLTVRAVQKMVKMRAVRAGVNKFVSPHVFRHSTATNMLRRGVGLRYVQEFLGHASIQNTVIYTHVVSNDLLEIHKKIHE